MTKNDGNPSATGVQCQRPRVAQASCLWSVRSVSPGPTNSPLPINHRARRPVAPQARCLCYVPREYFCDPIESSPETQIAGSFAARWRRI